MKLHWNNPTTPRRVYIADDPHLRLLLEPEGCSLAAIHEPDLLVRESAPQLLPVLRRGVAITDGGKPFSVPRRSEGATVKNPAAYLQSLQFRLRWYAPRGPRNWFERILHPDGGCYRPFSTNPSTLGWQSPIRHHSQPPQWREGVIRKVSLCRASETLTFLLDFGSEEGRTYPIPITDEHDAHLWEQLHLLGIKVGPLTDLSVLVGQTVLARVEETEENRLLCSVLYRLKGVTR